MSKTILITGTSTGFGKLMVKTLASEGHSVIATMRNSTTKNAEVAQELSALDNVEVVELDIADEVSVNSGIQKVLRKYGHIDILVNNAGVLGFGIFEGTSLSNMQTIFDINVWGTVRTTLAVLPSMREQNAGLIINVTSGLGIFSAPFIVPYAMSKFALEGMAEGLRTEIRDFNIETVTIPAGPFPTEISGKAGFGADRQEIIDAYGEKTAADVQKFGGNMFAKIEEYKADPQEVADAVRDLVNMKAGTRPNQTVVNRIGKMIDQKYADLKPQYKQEMFENLGWGDFAK